MLWEVDIYAAEASRPRVRDVAAAAAELHLWGRQRIFCHIKAIAMGGFR